MTHQTLSLEKYWKLFPATLMGSVEIGYKRAYNAPPHPLHPSAYAYIRDEYRQNKRFGFPYTVCQWLMQF